MKISDLKQSLKLKINKFLGRSFTLIQEKIYL